MADDLLTNRWIPPGFFRVRFVYVNIIKCLCSPHRHNFPHIPVAVCNRSVQSEIQLDESNGSCFHQNGYLFILAKIHSMCNGKVSWNKVIQITATKYSYHITSILGWSKNPVSSQTDKLMAGTKFSDYLGTKHYKKAKT